MTASPRLCTCLGFDFYTSSRGSNNPDTVYPKFGAYSSASAGMQGPSSNQTSGYDSYTISPSNTTAANSSYAMTYVNNFSQNAAYATPWSAPSTRTPARTEGIRGRRRRAGQRRSCLPARRNWFSTICYSFPRGAADGSVQSSTYLGRFNCVRSPMGPNYNYAQAALVFPFSTINADGSCNNTEITPYDADPANGNVPSANFVDTPRADGETCFAMALMLAYNQFATTTPLGSDSEILRLLLPD